MLKLESTNPFKILNKNIATGQAIPAEGLVLATILESGVEVIQPSVGGVSTEKFVGFSFAHTLNPANFSKVETIVIPTASPYTYTLARNNLVSGQISVNDGGTFMAITDPPIATDEFSVDASSGVVTFFSADAGKSVTVTYRYVPTTLEAQAVIQDPNINIANAFTVLGQCGVIMFGEVYTDQYDATVDWNTSVPKMGAAGIIASGGSDTSIPNAVVIHVPSTDNPYLGIRYL